MASLAQRCQRNYANVTATSSETAIVRRIRFFCFYGIAAAASASALANPADCGAARDPRRCEALLAARAACSELQGQARSACIRDALPEPDCTRASNVVQCQERQAAALACGDKRGRSYRKCLRGYKP